MFGTAWATLLAGCGPAILVKQPTERELGAAIDRINALLPTMKTGRWEVTTTRYALTGGEPPSTNARCRREPRAIDTYAGGALMAQMRPGCRLVRVTADPDRVGWSAQCRVETTIFNEDVDIVVERGRFTTQRTTSTGTDERDARTVHHSGRYAGSCRGDEVVQQTYWSDPR